VEAQAKGKVAAGKSKASAGRNPELAKEAGVRASDMLDAARQQGVWTEEIALESIRYVCLGSLCFWDFFRTKVLRLLGLLPLDLLGLSS